MRLRCFAVILFSMSDILEKCIRFFTCGKLYSHSGLNISFPYHFTLTSVVFMTGIVIFYHTEELKRTVDMPVKF